MNDITAIGAAAPIRDPESAIRNRPGGWPGLPVRLPCGHGAGGSSPGGRRRLAARRAARRRSVMRPPQGPGSEFGIPLSRLARTGLALRSDRRAVARENGLTVGSEALSRLCLTGAIWLRAAAFGRGGVGLHRRFRCEEGCGDTCATARPGRAVRSCCADFRSPGGPLEGCRRVLPWVAMPCARGRFRRPSRGGRAVFMRPFPRVARRPPGGGRGSTRGYTPPPPRGGAVVPFRDSPSLGPLFSAFSPFPRRPLR